MPRPRLNSKYSIDQWWSVIYEQMLLTCWQKKGQLVPVAAFPAGFASWQTKLAD